ncbi:MAG: ABC-F family ATP-binding cassette domain-containing protein [Spirochaetes bacterium]|nr:ABC-F family ATP-binding cassette domain-containing protein [Spirochaetota bacterium]
MTLIKLQNLSKSFGTQDVLVKINLQLNENRCYGLIGANGSGKTTLLNIIAHEEEPTSGSINCLPENQTGYVSQHLNFPENLTVIKAITNEFQPLFNQLKESEERLSVTTDDELEHCLSEYQKIRDAYDTIEGDTLVNRCETMLKALGLGDKLQQPVSSLSGGEQNVLGLASALIKRPNLLILDEPGNHLDFQGLAWLESFLLKFKGTILIVSHNRYLLDNLCDEILEIENGQISSYRGNYTAYRMAKIKKAMAQQADYKANQKRLAQLEELVKKFAQIARSRPDPAWGKRLKARKTQLEREKKNAVERPQLDQSKIQVQLETEVNKAKIALKVNQFTFGYTDQLLYEQANLELHCGEKAALVGPNGCGKTTLIKKIVTEGDWNNPVIQIGPSLKVGYLSQNQDSLNPDHTIEEEIRNLGSLDKNQAYRLLAPFLFTYADLDKKIDNLSGGEKNRLQLAKLKQQKADFLILDEPTNHLDIPSREAIEEALLDYQGTLLIISHDRYFLDKIATRIIEVKDQKLNSHLGNFSQYWSEQKVQVSNGRISKRGKQRSPLQDKNQSQFQIDQLEQRINQLEKEQKELEKRAVLAFQQGNHQQGKKISQELEKLQKILDDTYQKWEKLVS